MSRQVLAIVAYDLADDDRRAAAARALGAWLDRIQESVFVGPLAEHRFRGLVARMEEVVGRRGLLLAVGMCPACGRRAVRLGTCPGGARAVGGTVIAAGWGPPPSA